MAYSGNKVSKRARAPTTPRNKHGRFIKRERKRLTDLPENVLFRISDFVVSPNVIKLYPVDIYAPYVKPPVTVDGLRPRPGDVRSLNVARYQHRDQGPQFPGLMYTSKFFHRAVMRSIYRQGLIEVAILPWNPIYSELVRHSMYSDDDAESGFELRPKNARHRPNFEFLHQSSFDILCWNQARNRDLGMATMMPRCFTQADMCLVTELKVVMQMPLYGENKLPDWKDLWKRPDETEIREQLAYTKGMLESSLKGLQEIQRLGFTNIQKFDVRFSQNGFAGWGLMPNQKNIAAAREMRSILYHMIDTEIEKISLNVKEVVVKAKAVDRQFEEAISRVYETRSLDLTHDDEGIWNYTAALKKLSQPSQGLRLLDLPPELTSMIVSLVVAAPWRYEDGNHDATSQDVFEWEGFLSAKETAEQPKPPLMDVCGLFRQQVLLEMFKQKRIRLIINEAKSLAPPVFTFLHELIQWVVRGRSYFMFLPRGLMPVNRAKIPEVRLIIPIRAERAWACDPARHRSRTRPSELVATDEDISYTTRELQAALQSMLEVQHYGFSNVRVFHIHLVLKAQIYHWGIANNNPPSRTLPVVLTNIASLAASIRRNLDVQELDVDELRFTGEDRCVPIIDAIRAVYTTKHSRALGGMAALTLAEAVDEMSED